MEDNVFGVLDYTVFLGMLLISAGIGVFHAFKGQDSVEDVLVGGKSMGVIPVATSIMATIVSAAGLLGVTGEIFLYGTQLMFSNILILMPLITFLSSYFIVPVFYNLRTYSVNEYLERRFGKPIRALACIIYSLTMIFYMGIFLYAPAMALTQVLIYRAGLEARFLNMRRVFYSVIYVTGLSVWTTVWTTGLVCTFYTTIGGMKGVVWTDAFQTIVLFIAMIWIVTKGVMDVGGLGQVWRDNWETDRIVLFDFDPSPFVRVTFWSNVLGETISLLGVYATNQATVQRYLSLPTLRDAQKTVWTALPMFAVIKILTVLIGMIIVSKYRYCDPIKTQRITRADQLFPLFVMDTMGFIPGVPGIFVAGIFSASLSTVSSGINSLTAVVLEDIIRPYVFRRMTNTETLRLLKIMSVIFGLLSMVGATFAGSMGNIIQVSISVFGLLGAPMFGTFMLGLFVPHATNKGAVCGLICGFAFNLWMGIGAQFNAPYYPTKEKDYVEGCPEKYFNVTGRHFNLTANNVINQAEIDRTDAIFPIYRISFMYYMLVGVIVVMGVGTLMSFLFGPPKLHEMNPQLFVPPIRDAVEKIQREEILTRTRTTNSESVLDPVTKLST